MRSHRAKLLLALFSLYVIWGSTYLAIALAVRTIPPLLMGGVRLVTASAILFAVLKAQGERLPSADEWRGASISGALLLFGGNGLVVLSAGRLPSSIIALVIALTPLFVAVIPWLVGGGPRPSGRVGAALAVGVAGVALLVRAPGTGLAGDPVALTMVVGAVLSWSVGTLLARRLSLPKSPMMSTAAQMLSGGVLMGIAGIVRGELARVDAGAASFTSIGALVYLISFGSIVGFGAYQWLLKNTPPTVATSYAYVNPLVALVLGHLVDHDPLGLEVLGPAALIVGAVVLLLRGALSTPRAA